MRAALGIDIGGTNIKTGIVTTDGVVSYQRTIPTEASAGADALMQKLVEISRAAVTYSSDNGIELCGIGVGTAGQVNKLSGVVASATDNLPGWAGMRIGEKLTAETGLLCVVDNDVNMIAMGEAWLGAGKQWDDFLCVALGTGVGGCQIMNRSVHHGRDGYAGEFGHQIVQMDGVPCNCGNRGCWEQYASVSALKRLINEANLSENMNDPIPLFASAKEGEPLANRIVDTYATYIAVGLVNLIHANNPKAIVLGGAIMAQGEFLLERIRQQVNTRVLPIFMSPEAVHIVAAELGESAGVIGAVSSVWSSLGE